MSGQREVLSHVGDDIVRLAADVYRRQGHTKPGLPVGAMLAQVDRALLEHKLAELLDAGALVVQGAGSVALAPSLRLATLSQSVLATWVNDLASQSGPLRGMLEDAIRSELRGLAEWAQSERLPDELVQRAAELAGVLVTDRLDPSAMAIVATHGGSAANRLAHLLGLPEKSCASLEELRMALRRLVSTAFVPHPRA